MRKPDAAFADPRQAALYDYFDDDRSDLDAYMAIARECRARRVIDIGCGTGSLAVRLVGEGLEVVAVDPALASLNVAKNKPHAARVAWVHGDATTLVGRFPAADLAVMTGNVAQVFVSDQDWSDTLAAVHTCLRPGGRLVFETRRPEVRAWDRWDIPPTSTRIPDGREAVIERTVTVVAPPLVTFEVSTTIGTEVLRSTSTLRFRTREEIHHDLTNHGYTVLEVRDAPDRPGMEHVFIGERD